MPTTAPQSFGNTWPERSSGVNVPGGASSIVTTESFDRPVAEIASSTNQRGVTVSTSTGTFEDSLDTIVTGDTYAGAGSLKFAVPQGSAQDTSGSFHTDFSPDYSVGFGEGQEFFYQFKERIGPEFLNTSNWPDTEGFKSSIMSEGDRPGYDAPSCSTSPDEIVIQQDIDANDPYKPWIYTGCGSFLPPQIPLEDGSSDFLDQAQTGCSHYGRTFPQTDPPCFNYDASGFMTFQVHVKVGTWGAPNSTLEFWASHAGQPSRLVLSVSNWTLGNTNPGVSRYGKIWLLPYQTNMGLGGHGGALFNSAIWYDDLIVATRRIPDPDVAVPNAPDSLAVAIGSGSSVRVTWRVNSANGSAQDDQGFKVERCAGDAPTCYSTARFTQIALAPRGTATFTDTTAVHGTTYTYRVRATNASGDSAYAGGVCYATSVNPCYGTVTP